MDKDKFNILAFEDDQINNELIDALIKAGSHEYIQNTNIDIPDEKMSDDKFSKELDKKLRKYFATLNKKKRETNIMKFVNKAKNIAVRVAAVLFVLVALAAGFVATSKAAQIKLLHIYIEHSDIDSNIEFEETQTKIPEKQKIESLETIFWYIPDGYEFVYENQNSSTKEILYEGADDGYIEIIEMSEGNLRLDSEGANNYNVEVGEVTCFVSQHSDKTIVVFRINEKNYNIISTLPIEEIIKIIENINE